MVNKINANPLRSQNALLGGLHWAESIRTCWQTDWIQQHPLSLTGRGHQNCSDMRASVPDLPGTGSFLLKTGMRVFRLLSKSDF